MSQLLSCISCTYFSTMQLSAPLTTVSPNSSSECDIFTHQEVAPVIFPILYTLVFFISLLGNSLVLTISCQRRQKLNATSVYLVNLAVSDALFTVVLPTRITYYICHFDWPFGEMLCRVTTVLFYTNTYAGIAFMTCISMDRYLAMVHPQRAQGLRRLTTARRVCCVVWAITLLQTAPLLFKQMVTLDNGHRTCMEYSKLDLSPYILLLACVVGFCFPLGLILFCYSCISLKLLRTARHNPVVGRTGRGSQARSIILVILATFLLCFSPYHVNIIQHMVRRVLAGGAKPTCEQQRAFKTALQVTVSLMNLNCCLDPLIYFFAIKTYKERVVSFLRMRLSSANTTPSLRSGPENSTSNT
ncbi:hypothetical protein ACEWY4_023171 [Coilia grayii]|uniref:G-protein coupled receptors family 1 profile domain-containing protein n=1 Tax=Coilia grayii TaxID=363190 RepID=A0ABD1J5R2_9TELE